MPWALLLCYIHRLFSSARTQLCPHYACCCPSSFACARAEVFFFLCCLEIQLWKRSLNFVCSIIFQMSLRITIDCFFIRGLKIFRVNYVVYNGEMMLQSPWHWKPGMNRKQCSGDHIPLRYIDFKRVRHTSIWMPRPRRFVYRGESPLESLDWCFNSASRHFVNNCRIQLCTIRRGANRLWNIVMLNFGILIDALVSSRCSRFHP